MRIKIVVWKDVWVDHLEKGKAHKSEVYSKLWSFSLDQISPRFLEMERQYMRLQYRWESKKWGKQEFGLNERMENEGHMSLFNISLWYEN